jgi:hypothetical protein
MTISCSPCFRCELNEASYSELARLHCFWSGVSEIGGKLSGSIVLAHRVLAPITNGPMSSRCCLQPAIPASQAKDLPPIFWPGREVKGRSVPASDSGMQPKRIPTIFAPFHSGYKFSLAGRESPPGSVLLFSNMTLLMANATYSSFNTSGIMEYFDLGTNARFCFINRSAAHLSAHSRHLRVDFREHLTLTSICSPCMHVRHMKTEEQILIVGRTACLCKHLCNSTADAIRIFNCSVGDAHAEFFLFTERDTQSELHDWRDTGVHVICNQGPNHGESCCCNKVCYSKSL